jgi:hypothetical protein
MTLSLLGPLLLLGYSPTLLWRPSLAPARSAPCVTRGSTVTSQLPDFGKMGSDFMDKMGLGNTGLSEEETKSMEARLRAGEMSFDDFLTQVNVMQKGASLQAMLGKLGGGQQEAAQL